MSTASINRFVSLIVVALALAGCRDDSTGITEAVASSPLASLHDADDPPQFSDWSAPVNLGPTVNAASAEL